MHTPILASNDVIEGMWGVNTNYQRPRAALSAYIAAVRVPAEVTAGSPSVPLPRVQLLRWNLTPMHCYACQQENSEQLCRRVEKSILAGILESVKALCKKYAWITLYHSLYQLSSLKPTTETSINAPQSNVADQLHHYTYKRNPQS